MKPQITTLFVDIGGVLLTNGWGRALRKKTAEKFELDYLEMDQRHNLTYDTYELGKTSWDVYLQRIIFYKPRPFTIAEVKKWVLEEAKPFPEMISLVRKLREVHHLKIAVVSNEGRELATDRILRYHLHEFVDFFIVSSFVHFRKPDEDIYRVALDVAQVHPEHVAYLEDRPMFVEVANSLGINGVLVAENDATGAQKKLADLGLTL